MLTRLRQEQLKSKFILYLGRESSVVLFAGSDPDQGPQGTGQFCHRGLIMSINSCLVKSITGSRRPSDTPRASSPGGPRLGRAAGSSEGEEHGRVPGISIGFVRVLDSPPDIAEQVIVVGQV